MKKEIDFRKKWIQWVFDFTEMDLNSLSLSKKARFDKKVAFFSWLSFNPSWPESQLKYFPYLPKDISDIQDSLKDIVEWSISVAKVYALGDRFDVFNIRSYTLNEVTPTMGIQFFKEDIFEMSLEPKDEENEETPWAIYNFMQLLNGFPINMIGQCKCGRNFVRVRKTKDYCSDKCYQKYFHKARMEGIKTNPAEHEAYRKKKADYQSRRYRLKTLGKWNPY